MINGDDLLPVSDDETQPQEVLLYTQICFLHRFFRVN